MATLSYPGVYMEEVSSGVRPIGAVGTSTAAFVGRAERGPTAEAKRITNWTEFQKYYGAFIKESYLAQSVFQFFNNGGSKCYILRVTKSGATAATCTVQNRAVPPVDAITFSAKNEGAWGNGKVERCRNEGKTIFLAISSEEGPRTRLSEGKILAVCLEYIKPSDFEIGGPRCKHKNRLCDLKSVRIVRYARQARDQGALLSLPDIAMLMGIGVDTVRNLIKAKANDANDGVIVPTRGLMKDIGRGVSHKGKIIELYLQMYTETEKEF
jgi:hypothetical protein